MNYRGTIDVCKRVGVDSTPIDPTTATGQLRLKAYVWPDQLDRFECLTTLWHSVMGQYVDAAEQLEILKERNRLVADATPDSPFAHISFEPPVVGDHIMDVVLRLWPLGKSWLLGRAPAHGVPVDWFDSPQAHHEELSS